MTEKCDTDMADITDEAAEEQEISKLDSARCALYGMLDAYFEGYLQLTGRAREAIEYAADKLNEMHEKLIDERQARRAHIIQETLAALDHNRVVTVNWLDYCNERPYVACTEFKAHRLDEKLFVGETLGGSTLAIRFDEIVSIAAQK